MSKEPQPTSLVSKKGIVIDLALTACFFLFMREVLVPHVPSQDPVAVTIVSSMTAFCMSGVFWLAAGMFRVTLVDYQRNKKIED
jgi:hypothetical protein